MAQGRLDTERFYRRELAALHARMTPDLLEEAGSLSDLEAFRNRVDELAGRESAVLDEDTFSSGDIAYYRRTVTFDGTDETMAVQWGYRGGDAIADFFIRPIEPGTSVEYRTRTPLRLPFDGDWYVTSGGRTVEENQHGRDYANRFAYDAVFASDLEAEGPFESPSDFDTWEQPILAPATGTVVGALDTSPDHALDVIRGTPAIGNHVVIDHGNGEFSVLGHLRQGSVRVAPGDSVAAGDLLGLVGNSGNSSGPHLHYNLQDGPEPNGARGLPAQFLEYTADGAPVDRGEPVRGQVIRNRRPEARPSQDPGGGTGTVEGTVLDEDTGLPAARGAFVCVTVRLADALSRSACAHADSLGAYEIEGIPAGRRPITVSCVPFRSLGLTLGTDSVTVVDSAATDFEWRVSLEGCDHRPFRRVEGTFRGFYTSGFEASSFVPCPADAWFVPSDSLDAIPYDAHSAWLTFSDDANADDVPWPDAEELGDIFYPTAFLIVRGVVEGPGRYGHLGVSAFELLADSILEVRVPAPGDCS